MRVTNLSKTSLASRIGVNERTIDRHVADLAMGFHEGTLKLIKGLVIEEIGKSDQLSISDQEYLLDSIRKYVSDWPDEDEKKIIHAETKLAHERLKLRKARNKRGDAGNV